MSVLLVPLVFLGRGPPSSPRIPPLFLGARKRNWLETPGANRGPGHHEHNLASTAPHNHFIPLTITRNLLGRALTVAATIALPLRSSLPCYIRLLSLFLRLSLFSASPSNAEPVLNKFNGAVVLYQGSGRTLQEEPSKVHVTLSRGLAVDLRFPTTRTIRPRELFHRRNF